MGEVIDFLTAQEITVEVELDEDVTTLETVLDALRGNHNITNIAIIYEEEDGKIYITSDGDEVDTINLVNDFIEGY